MKAIPAAILLSAMLGLSGTALADIPKTSFDFNMSPLTESYLIDITANTLISKGFVVGMGIQSIKGQEVNMNTLSVIAGLPISFGARGGALFYGRPTVGDAGYIEIGAGSQAQFMFTNKASLTGRVQTDNFRNIQANLFLGYEFKPGLVGRVGVYSRLYDASAQTVSGSAGFSMRF